MNTATCTDTPAVVVTVETLYPEYRDYRVVGEDARYVYVDAPCNSVPGVTHRLRYDRRKRKTYCPTTCQARKSEHIHQLATPQAVEYADDRAECEVLTDGEINVLSAGVAAMIDEGYASVGDRIWFDAVADEAEKRARLRDKLARTKASRAALADLYGDAA